MTDDLNRLRADEKGQIHVAVCQDHNQRNPARDSPNTHAVVESIVAARTAALLDRAERAETERDQLRESLPKRTNDWLAHCKRLDAERDAVSDQLAEAWKELGQSESDLAALRAAVAPRQDVLYPQKWAFGAAANYEMGVRNERTRLRSLLTAAPTETEGTPDE